MHSSHTVVPTRAPGKQVFVLQSARWRCCQEILSATGRRPVALKRTCPGWQCAMRLKYWLPGSVAEFGQQPVDDAFAAHPYRILARQAETAFQRGTRSLCASFVQRGGIERDADEAGLRSGQLRGSQVGLQAGFQVRL